MANSATGSSSIHSSTSGSTSTSHMISNMISTNGLPGQMRRPRLQVQLTNEELLFVRERTSQLKSRSSKKCLESLCQEVAIRLSGSPSGEVQTCPVETLYGVAQRRPIDLFTHIGADLDPIVRVDSQ